MTAVRCTESYPSVWICSADRSRRLRSILDRSRGVSGAISLSSGADMSWVNADVVELVAFALHVQIPIFLNMTDEPGTPRLTLNTRVSISLQYSRTC